MFARRADRAQESSPAGRGRRFLRHDINIFCTTVFFRGNTPESLWTVRADETESPAGPETEADAGETDLERADVFSLAMRNNFCVGSVVIDAILEGTF